MESALRRTIRVAKTIIRSDASTAYWFAHEQPDGKREAKAILYGLWITLVAMAILTAADQAVR